MDLTGVGYHGGADENLSKNVSYLDELFDWDVYLRDTDTGLDTEEARLPHPEAIILDARRTSGDSMKLTVPGYREAEDQTASEGRDVRAQHRDPWNVFGLRLAERRPWTIESLTPFLSLRDWWWRCSDTKASARHTDGSCALDTLAHPPEHPDLPRFGGFVSVSVSDGRITVSPASPTSPSRRSGACCRCQRRVAASVIDCASILAGGVATVAILNFNQISSEARFARVHENRIC
jgi:hypothetical protein